MRVFDDTSAYERSELLHQWALTKGRLDGMLRAVPELQQVYEHEEQRAYHAVLGTS